MGTPKFWSQNSKFLEFAVLGPIFRGTQLILPKNRTENSKSLNFLISGCSKCPKLTEYQRTCGGIQICGMKKITQNWGLKFWVGRILNKGTENQRLYALKINRISKIFFDRPSLSDSFVKTTQNYQDSRIS